MDFNPRKPLHLFTAIIVLGALFLLVVSPILSYIGTLPTTQEIDLSEWLIILSFLITMAIFLLVPFLWYVLVNEFSFREMLKALQIKKTGWEQAIFWSILAVIFMFCIVILGGLVVTFLGFGEEDVSNIEDLAGNLSLVSLLLVVVFQSAGEELFFRGFLLEKLHTMAGKQAAIIITSILFGLAHLSYGQVYTSVLTALLGVVLAYVVLKTRNLGAAMLAHILYNGASFVLYFFYQTLSS